ncbi:MAG: hypothetical protein PHR06_07350 [Candidatus Cloacimonetes bacterium]|nr:hypothetical protein [Candidatus Cloacimonadota bacterium]
MNKVTYISIIFVFWINIYPQVYLDKVDIESEFYGIFVKNKAEFTFTNPSVFFNLEAKCSFFLDGLVSITNLWIEKEGKLIESTTFDQSTGLTVDGQNDYLRTFPVVLTRKEMNHHISIYPIKESETCKVVVEYYSILKQESHSFIWSFKARDDNSTYRNIKKPVITLTVYNDYFPYEEIRHKNLIVESDCKNIYSLEDKGELKIEFFLYDEKKDDNWNLMFWDNSYLAQMNVGKRDYQTREIAFSVVPNFFSVKDFIRKFNQNVSRLHIDTIDDYFLKMIDYIERKHPETPLFYPMFRGWSSFKNGFQFGWKKFDMVLTRNHIDLSKAKNAVFCPYLGHFYKYLESVKASSLQYQKKSLIESIPTLGESEKNAIIEREREAWELEKSLHRKKESLPMICFPYSYGPTPILVFRHSSLDSLLNHLQGKLMAKIIILKDGSTVFLDVMSFPGSINESIVKGLPVPCDVEKRYLELIKETYSHFEFFPTIDYNN